MATIKIPYGGTTYPLFMNGNKITTPSIAVGGQGYIFNIVYNQLFGYYANAVEDGYENEIEGFKKMIDNFAALTSFAVYFEQS